MENLNSIKKIKNTDPKKIAEVLGHKINQANKFKRGYSGLSLEQAFELKCKLKLSPYAFYLIHKSYKEKHTTNNHNTTTPQGQHESKE